MKTEFRILIIPDTDPYDFDFGDMDKDSREETIELIERNGLWGYVVEKRSIVAPEACSHCGHKPAHEWTQVDSCFQFVGSDSSGEKWFKETGMADYINIPENVKVPVYNCNERGIPYINTAEMFFKK